MRYWAYLAAKLLLSVALPAALWLLVAHFLLAGEPRAWPVRALAKIAVGPFFMLASALVCLSLRDQRLRCRVCARRLRMPLNTGTFGSVLFDYPGTEYICPFGHGKLYVSAPMASREGWWNWGFMRWTGYRDIWQHLFK